MWFWEQETKHQCRNALRFHVHGSCFRKDKVRFAARRNAMLIQSFSLFHKLLCRFDSNTESDAKQNSIKIRTETVMAAEKMQFHHPCSPHVSGSAFPAT